MGRVRCSAWLGRRFIAKTCDDPTRPPFRVIDNTRVQLAEVDDYPGTMAVLIDALKKKGVRLDEARLQNSDVAHLNKYVTIIRGDTAEFLDRAFQCVPSGLTRKQRWQGYLRRVCLRLTHHLGIKNMSVLFKSIHKRSRPNDPSSATRPTRALDCNLDAIAGFAAAHG